MMLFLRKLTANINKIIGTELQINPVNGPAVNQVRTKQWVFLSRNRENKCTIESDNIVFSIEESKRKEYNKNSKKISWSFY